jgi:YesN/AraC family two-component response regulator
MKLEVLIIKNMTCSSCVKLVEYELKRLRIKNISVKLGEAKIDNSQNISHEKIRNALQKHGFDLVDNHEEQLTEGIRLAILELVNDSEGIGKELRFTDYLETKFKQPYKHLSKIFSKHKKESIENFFIHLKIEKAKELIQYGEINFTDIAYKLGYANPQHLSGQFRKITGYTMSEFKARPSKKRISVNKL